MIYLDNAATTHAVGTGHICYNPSSPHALGISAERALRDARKKIAGAFNLTGCTSHNAKRISSITSPDEIIFTTGGTESNNLAILGYALAKQRLGINLVSSAYEHPSVTSPIRFAFDRMWAMADGSHLLLALSHVNHETGDINNINEIAAEIKKNTPNAIVLVDGAQGFCKEPLNLSNIDMYSFSGHKFHGPACTGGLWIKKGIRLTPLLHGGGQESGLRPGTENVSGIIQMSDTALDLAQNLSANYAHVSKLKSILLNLCENLPDSCVNCLSANTSPYILNISFLGVKGEVLVHALSEQGVYVSIGAACNSRKRAQSALELMGFSQEIAQAAIRISFSPYNTSGDAEKACEIISATVSKLRKQLRQ